MDTSPAHEQRPTSTNSQPSAVAYVILLVLRSVIILYYRWSIYQEAQTGILFVQHLHPWFCDGCDALCSMFTWKFLSIIKSKQPIMTHQLETERRQRCCETFHFPGISGFSPLSAQAISFSAISLISARRKCWHFFFSPFLKIFFWPPPKNYKKFVSSSCI